jgi:hypothetical protein
VRPSTTASAAGYRLDAGSTTWYSAVCTGQRELQQLASPSTGSGATQQQAVVVATYQALAKSATGTAGKLTALAPPSTPGGAQQKSVQVAVYKAIAAGYDAGAKQVAAARPATTDALRTVVEKVESDVTAAADKASAGAPEIDPQVQSAIELLPACKS